MIQFECLFVLMLTQVARSFALNLESDFSILEEEFRSSNHDNTYFNSIDGTMMVMVQVETSIISSLHESNIMKKVDVNSKGYSIIGLKVNEKELDVLKRDPSVTRITPNYKVSVVDDSIDVESENRRKLEEYLEWNIALVMQDYEFFREKYPEGSVKVCIADTGYDINHEDLPKSPYVDGTDGEGESWMYDGNGHGTHVAGVVAALGGNGKGVYGIIPNNYGGKFQLLISKPMGATGQGSQLTTINAVNDCVAKGANVITLSLGCAACSNVIENSFYQSIADQNILVFAASGNDGNSEYLYPASYDSVISVASITSDFQRSSFSQYNDQVELTAPGSRIYSTWPGNAYKIEYGTSMATPHAAAVAALLWMFFPQCTNAQIRNVLAFTAMDLDVKGCDVNTGFGLIQAKDAYDRLSLGNCGLLEGSPSGGCYDISEVQATPIIESSSPIALPAPTTMFPSPIPTLANFPTDGPPIIESSSPTALPAPTTMFPSLKPTLANFPTDDQESSLFPTEISTNAPKTTNFPTKDLIAPSMSTFTRFPTKYPHNFQFPTKEPTAAYSPSPTLKPTIGDHNIINPPTNGPTISPTAKSGNISSPKTKKPKKKKKNKKNKDKKKNKKGKKMKKKKKKIKYEKNKI